LFGNAGDIVLFSVADGSLVRKLLAPEGSAGDQLGVSLTSLEDVTGDGVLVVAAGANLDDQAIGSTAGSAAIFSGADGAFARLSPTGSGLSRPPNGAPRGASRASNGSGSLDERSM
jgi:hypothetical protein